MVILTSFALPEDGIRHKQENTSAHVAGQLLGDGALYIAESRLSWMGSQGLGFCLDYPAISLHAVSRDVNTFPQHCLYLMVDAKLTDDIERQSDGSEDEEDEAHVSEIRFIPSDKGALDAMFNAMTDCQALHPDEQDTDSEAEEEVTFYGEDEGDQLTSDGQVILQHLDSLLQVGQGEGQVIESVEVDNEANEEVDRPGGLPVAQNGHEAMETGQFDDADMQQ